MNTFHDNKLNRLYQHKPKPEQVHRTQGAALLITLSVITVLLTIALEINRNVRSMVMATAAKRDRLTLTYMCSSGINIGMAILIKDKMGDPPNGFDSIQEDWANPEKIREILQDFSFSEGTLALSIQDELGKIQVNALVSFPEGRLFNQSQQIMWDRFTRSLLELDDSLQDLDVSEIINSVKDWLDFGDDDAITGLSGAESDYYKSLDPPYECRNGPMPHISDLLLVKGVTPALYYGADDRIGVSSVMTVYGMQEIRGQKNRFTFPGRININTADLPVLMAIMPSENPEYAQAVYSYRQETDGEGNYVNSLAHPMWYRNVPGIPSDFTIDSNLITNSSDWFRIEAEASLHNMTMKVSAVVQRVKKGSSGGWTCRVVSWEEGAIADRHRGATGSGG